MSAPSKERQAWMAKWCKGNSPLGCKPCFPPVGRPDCPALAEMPDDYARGLEDGRREGREALDAVKRSLYAHVSQSPVEAEIDAQREKLEGK